MKSGQYDDTDSSSMPLSQCDFSLGGSETGDLIRELLQLGKIFTLKLHHQADLSTRCFSGQDLFLNLNFFQRISRIFD